MTEQQYENLWNTYNDHIEYNKAEMFAIAERLTNTEYASFNDQLNDGMKLGRIAKSIKKAQARIIKLNQQRRA